MKETTNEKNAHKNLTYSKRHKEEYLNMGQGGGAKNPCPSVDIYKWEGWKTNFCL